MAAGGRKSARTNPATRTVRNCAQASARIHRAFSGEPGRDERNRVQTDFWLMNYDEFAFFNQQLGAMLRDGIPLEGALRRLCHEMRAGSLRDELQALEADLARGTPMA